MQQVLQNENTKFAPVFLFQSSHASEQCCQRNNESSWPRRVAEFSCSPSCQVRGSINRRATTCVRTDRIPGLSCVRCGCDTGVQSKKCAECSNGSVFHVSVLCLSSYLKNLFKSLFTCDSLRFCLHQDSTPFDHLKGSVVKVRHVCFYSTVSVIWANTKIEAWLIE